MNSERNDEPVSIYRQNPCVITSVPKRTRQGLLKKTQEHMTMVQSSPERVKSCFKDKHVAYAADSQ